MARSDKNERLVQSWIKDSYSPPRKLVRWSKGFYHNRVPRKFRFSGVLHWLAKTGMASSAPVVAWAYGSISGLLATGVAGAIFVGHSTVSFLDNLSKEKAIQSDDNQTDIVVRFGDLLVAHKVRGTLNDIERDDAIRACLGVLEVFSRQITRSRSGDISVSLVLYSGSSRTRMKVRYRNPGNTRPVNREVDADRMLGHIACVNDALPRVVHDLREFGRGAVASPTQSHAEYRSIFFFPLAVGEGTEKVVRGFVSIDCKRPYAFYGNRSNAIVVTCEPILSHIGELIQETRNGRSRQRTARQ